MRLLLWGALLLACAAGAEAQAFDYSGVWKGQGGLLLPTQPPVRYECPEVVFEFAQTADSITFLQQDVRCGDMGLGNDPLAFSIRGTELLYKNEIVGTIDETGIVVQFEFKNLRLIREGEELRLNWVEYFDDHFALTAEGRLNRGNE